MRVLFLAGLLVVSTASAQRDPVLYAHPENLRPYRTLCLAAEQLYPHEMKSADVAWLRRTIQEAARTSGLPGLQGEVTVCPSRRTSPAQGWLVVQVSPSLKAGVPWPLVVRVIDPALRGADGHVYHPILWELRHDLGASRAEVDGGLRGALKHLRRSWYDGHVK